MPHHEHIEIEGRITDVFCHRFVVELTSGKKLLADIGPKGLELFPLAGGIEILASGEMKPTEIKIDRIARKGGTAVAIPNKKPHHHGPGHGPHRDHAHADAEVAKRAVEHAGGEAIGTPRRKPKHFEVLARHNGKFVEYHVEFDGRIRTEKPVASGDRKWADWLAPAA